MTSPVFTPLQMFYSTSGLPLTDGYIYIGTASQNPQTNPIAVYWDAAGTIPAAQPIRTSGGYPVRNGSPATVFVLATDFSLIVRDKTSSLVFSRLSDNAFSAEWVTYIPAGTGAVATTAQAKLRESVSVFDFMTAAQIADVQSGAASLDVTVAVQAAHDAAQGKKLYFPKGKYKLTATITNTYTNPFWYGDVGDRFIDGGTEIASSALVLFKNGTDNGLPWEGNYYDGPQGMVFQDLWFSNSAPDTNLSGGGSGGSTQQYKANSYAIQDWRGGSVELRGKVGFERFAYSFWGINSDINNFENVYQLYCKFGIYAGPRSDQFTIQNFYPIYCDTALIVDGATGVRILNPQIVNCGTSSAYAIDIRCGSGSVTIDNAPWFEHLNGYNGVNQAGFIGVGMYNGWIGNTSTGGRTNATPVQGVTIQSPFIYTTVAAAAYHTKYLCDVGLVNDLFLNSPEPPAGQNLNIDNLFNLNNAPEGGAHTTTNTTAFARIHQRDLAKLYGAFTGTPEVGYYTFGFSGNITGNVNGRFFLDRIGASAGADRMMFGSENVVGQLLIDFPNLGTWQTARLKLLRSMQQATAMPSSGNWQQGDIVWNMVPTNAAGQVAGWIRITSGSGNVLNTDWRAFGVTI